MVPSFSHVRSEARSHFCFQLGPPYGLLRSQGGASAWGASAAPSWDSGGLPSWEGTAGAERRPFAASRGPEGWGTWGAVWGPPSAPGLYPLSAASPTESWKPGGQGSPIVASVGQALQGSVRPPGVQGGASEARTRPPAEPGSPPEGSQDAPPELRSEPHSASHMAEPGSGDRPRPGAHRAFT